MYSSAAIRTTTQGSSWTLSELLDIKDGGTEGGKGSALLVRGPAVMLVLGCLGLSPQTRNGYPSSGSGWSFSLLLSVVYWHWDSYCFFWLVTTGNGEHWHVASPQHLFVGWTRGCHGIRSSVASEPESSPTWLKGRRNHDSSLYYLIVLLQHQDTWQMATYGSFSSRFEAIIHHSRDVMATRPWVGWPHCVRSQDVERDVKAGVELAISSLFVQFGS